MEVINYVEFPANNMVKTKGFFETAFGWRFSDFGEDYMAFDQQGIEGGFYRSEKTSRTENGAALIVFLSNNIEASLKKIKAAGGEVVVDIFSFPGGRRFHFVEPSGNEFAVWTKTTGDE